MCIHFLSKLQVANSRGLSVCVAPHLKPGHMRSHELDEARQKIINNDRTGSLELAPAKQPLGETTLEQDSCFIQTL